MNNEASYESSSLRGSIISIPLMIIDDTSRAVIKESRLYLHCSEIPDEEGNDESPNTAVTAICQEGSFHIDITYNTWQQCRKPQNKYSTSEWNMMLSSLFPLEMGVDLNERDNDILMNAKLVSLKSNYSETNNELLDDATGDMNDFLTIDIKRTGVFPVTVGSLILKIIDDLDDLKRLNGLSVNDEQDLFKWMDLLMRENKNLQEQLSESKLSLKSLIRQNRLISDNYEESEKHHRIIVDDLQDKFYQLLNAKKDKIWQLQNERPRHLTDLNKGLEKRPLKRSPDEELKEEEFEGSTVTAPKRQKTENKIVKKENDDDIIEDKQTRLASLPNEAGEYDSKKPLSMKDEEIVSSVLHAGESPSNDSLNDTEIDSEESKSLKQLPSAGFDRSSHSDSDGDNNIIDITSPLPDRQKSDDEIIKDSLEEHSGSLRQTPSPKESQIQKRRSLLPLLVRASSELPNASLQLGAETEYSSEGSSLT